MNRDSVIVNIKHMNDINKITSDTKYINININEVDTDVLDYLIINGNNYSYADSINGKNGFIYASYDMFKYGESVVDNIIDSMPGDLNGLEKVRYIYISLGKILSCDINVIEEKNESVSFGNISTINNIWGSLSKGMVNDSVVSKVFMYICSRIGIKTELINTNINGKLANKVYVDDTFIIVNLFEDIYNIQSGRTTSSFDKYNDNKEIDKKIGYIKEEYMDYYLDKEFKGFDYTNENVLFNILSISSSLIDIGKMGTYEMFKLYKDLFDKYIPNYDIKINNLYVYGKDRNREHFVIFSDNDSYYSYNYNKGCFINIDSNILDDNICDCRIGIYEGEEFEIMKKGMVL